MRYALLNEQRIEAQPKLRGICPGCRNEVSAKCGVHKIWHWAHLKSASCDPWWEPETQWHRDWKNRFLLECQEVQLVDRATMERHIADVRTPAGLVIEFQRSTITSEEVDAREKFYQKMVWVIDGTKNDNDPVYFKLGRTKVGEDGFVNFSVIGRSKLFHRWHRHKPVFIDFGIEGFWRIANFDPKIKKGIAILVNRDGFAKHAASGTTDFSNGGGPANAV
ncbi:competence protein CoiA [Comamonas avium]|uniref:Competence protein CoiA-like N-terminal domain-containing protein n=1 Tax=Comamonas avium TaxID=2762231 RepID=A0ABR8SG20_9BURK|nr:competence protein CoiA family protein [Comamonas avium]MBD7962402.1 hypothetical protein [Comamonas avium]